MVSNKYWDGVLIKRTKQYWQSFQQKFSSEKTSELLQYAKGAYAN